MPEAPHPRTLTHARLRRAQGDTRGAVAILEALIDAGEEGDDLVRLYMALGGDRQRPHAEPEAVAEDAASPTEADALREAFRRELGPATPTRNIRRLQRWLMRVRRERS